MRKTEEYIEFISTEDIRAILEHLKITDIDLDEVRNSISLIDKLQSLCKLYKSLLDTSLDKKYEKAAYAIGANIIFNFRKLLMDKDITLLIGAVSKDDNSKNYLKILEAPLTKVLLNPEHYTINSKGLELVARFENYNTMNKLKNEDISVANDDRMASAVWKKIVKAQELTGGYKTEFDTQDVANRREITRTYFESDEKVKVDRKYMIYRRNKHDQNVWYAHKHLKRKGEPQRGRPDHYVKYYHLGGNRYAFFNEGWLWEWFMKQWKNPIDKQILKQTDNPLRTIIGRVDSIEGYKGGDFRSGTVKCYDYQAKYGNKKIITNKAIEEVMNEMIDLLTIYKNDYSSAFGKKLARLFTSEQNLDLRQINSKTYNKVVDAISKNLLTKINCPVLDKL